MKNESHASDGRLIRALMKRSQAVTCGAGGTLFKQGETPKGLYVLEQGEAALMMASNAGRAVMCVEVGPGSVLGLPAVIANEPYTMTAFVRKGSAVSFISREDFELIVREEPELYPSILQILATEVRSVRQAIKEA
jgi:CRP/FNR family transcriptional regulator, dissimilatory nitrate respiration regulator